jgi:hypothetical protein
MARSLFIAFVALPAMLAAMPASAQLQFPNILDSIFGNPPRPPQDVPGGRPPSQPQYVPPPIRQQQQQQAPQTGLPPGPPPGRIQMQPLPPPPGGASAPASVRPSEPAPQPGIGPSQGPAQKRPPPAGSAALQPGDEVVVEPPAQKITNPSAVFAGLDKITGRIISFDVAINETVRFGALEVTPRACYTRPATEAANIDGFVEVDELTLQGELRRIFTGWMFAASPGLSAVEHPIYDIWLTDCKGGKEPTVAAETPPAAPAPPRAQQRTQPPPQRRATQQLPPPPAAQQPQQQQSPLSFPR